MTAREAPGAAGGLLEALAAKAEGGAASRVARWYADPLIFAAECVSWPKGQSLAAYQADVLGLLAGERRVAVRSLHGAGKTTTAALAVLWFSVTRELAGVNHLAVTTAGAWRQLERYLWPEITKWARRLRWPVLGIEPFGPDQLMRLSLRLEHGQAFAAAASDPALIEGAHADSLLVLIDEAKAVEAATWDALEGALSGTGETFALASSTPGTPAGRFFDIHARRPGLEEWATRHVTLEEAVGAGRVSSVWADARRRQWGPDSALFLNRVLGEFATNEEDGVVPLSWVEAAVERWRAWQEAGAVQGESEVVVGVDVARSGADDTVLAVRRGPVVVRLERHSHADTMVTAGHVAAKLRHPSHVAVVDVIGIGAGVVDRLREQQFSVVGFHASERPTRRDRSGELEFANMRAQGWWRLREMLDPQHDPVLALPDDDMLIGDLCAPRWSMTSTGRLLIEGKDEIRARLGRSPDAGDAVVMCLQVKAPFGERGSGDGPVVFRHAESLELAADPSAAIDRWNTSGGGVWRPEGTGPPVALRGSWAGTDPEWWRRGYGPEW